MPYEIKSPTGVSITKTLTEEEATKLKADSYFKLTPKENSLDDFFSSVEAPKKVRVFTGESVCISCEG